MKFTTYALVVVFAAVISEPASAASLVLEKIFLSAQRPGPYKARIANVAEDGQSLIGVWADQGIYKYDFSGKAEPTKR